MFRVTLMFDRGDAPSSATGGDMAQTESDYRALWEVLHDVQRGTYGQTVLGEQVVRIDRANDYSTARFGDAWDQEVLDALWGAGLIAIGENFRMIIDRRSGDTAYANYVALSPKGRQAYDEWPGKRFNVKR
jgi:hypothetical protein